MQEIEDQKKPQFDYSLVNDEVASYLQDRVKTMHKIFSDNDTQIDEQFYLSQKKLADFNNERISLKTKGLSPVEYRKQVLTS